MSRVRDALAALADAVTSLGRRSTDTRRRRGDASARAICPTDSWAFTPLYTDGHCPLCGWTPDGYVHRTPFLTPYERYWGALGGIAALSVVMCIVVVIASAHS